jgi:DNA ligase D-like protein (predicted ligase)
MSLPQRIPPMLASSGEPFDSDDHYFEPKWDGIRCIGINRGSLMLHSRSLRDITSLFPEIVEPRIINQSFWAIDGELICLDADGRPSFELIKRRLVLKSPGKILHYSKTTPAIYMVFDLLYHKGETIMTEPLCKRREILERELLKSSVVGLSPILPHKGLSLYQAVCQNGLEGIMAKHIHSPYLSGKRSTAWIKVRCIKTGVFYIIGYIPQEPKGISSLALAKKEKNQWKYIGQVGSGFKESDHRQLSAYLSKLITGNTILAKDHLIKPQSGIIWIEPKLQCQVEFLEFSPSGILRQAVFKGLVRI